MELMNVISALENSVT